MSKKITMQLSRLPHLPGVYLFYDGAGKLLYVGKSGSLRSRVQSYFRADFAVYNAAKQAMIPQSFKIKHRVTDSEIEALILEAALIKKLKPKFNRLMRDDKSYRWVAITRDVFPKIFLTHQPKTNQLISYKLKASYIGPFTQGLALKDALYALRRIFPYCTCKTLHRRPCLNAQVGKCPGHCCALATRGSVPPLAGTALPFRSSELSEGRPAFVAEADTSAEWARRVPATVREYGENIKNLKKVLTGGKRALVRRFEKEMAQAAASRQYERAAQLRNLVHALNTFMNHRHVIRVGSAKHVLAPEKPKTALLNFDPLTLNRVECYDISNLQGRQATASMVVFALGEPLKSEYRRFKIRLKQTPDDYAMLREALGRRLKHLEWPRPDLILIDGGIGQRGAVSALVEKIRPPVILVSLAKREEILYTSSTLQTGGVPLKNLPESWANFFMFIRDEAHRFALKYHRYLRDKHQITKPK